MNDLVQLCTCTCVLVLLTYWLRLHRICNCYEIFHRNNGNLLLVKEKIKLNLYKNELEFVEDHRNIVLTVWTCPSNLDWLGWFLMPLPVNKDTIKLVVLENLNLRYWNYRLNASVKKGLLQGITSRELLFHSKQYL